MAAGSSTLVQPCSVCTGEHARAVQGRTFLQMQHWQSQLATALAGASAYTMPSSRLRSAPHAKIAMSAVT